MFYMNNPYTRAVKYFTAEVWVATTIKSLLKFTLSLWTDRCDVLHGATEEERKMIRKKRTAKKVERCYSDKNMLI